MFGGIIVQELPLCDVKPGSLNLSNLYLTR